jgi:hypothetical protein
VSPGVAPGAAVSPAVALGTAEAGLATIVSVVVAIRVPDEVLAEIRPLPTLALVGIVNGRLNPPELDAEKASTTPPL